MTARPFPDVRGGDEREPIPSYCDLVAELERYQRALHGHLCRHDAADWLACTGEHGDGYCDVCDEVAPHSHLRQSPKNGEADG